MCTPLVSVIVPNYNHREYIRQRIDSILEQTFTNFELILLDDCSTDGSTDILLSYRNNPHISHIAINTSNTNSPFKQWEKGLKLAKGEFIWIAESDDYADPNFLLKTVELLNNHPQAALCLTGSYIVNEKNEKINNDEFDQWEEDGKTYSFQSKHYLKSYMLRTNTIYNASMVLFRKKYYTDGIPSQYKKMRYCGDWLFWIELIRKGGIVIELHQKLNYFRKHSLNTTSQGTKDGCSIGEIAYIRHIMYQYTFDDAKEIILDKYGFYKWVKNYPVTSYKRKKELLNIIAKNGGITYLDYLKGYLLSRLRHFH